MKKRLTALLAFAMVPLVLAGCSTSNKKDNAASESLSRSDKVSMANSTSKKIHWKGGVYTTKYSLKQMQQKFNVHYSKTKQSKNVYVYHNEYMGLTRGSNIKNQAKGVKSTQGKITDKNGYYAAFFTYDSKQNFQSKKYVSLKDGNLYVQRF